MSVAYMRGVGAALCLGLAAGAITGPAGADVGWFTHADTQNPDMAGNPIALQFRRVITLQRKPAAMPIRITADNRFVLFVNGQRAVQGPARGDHDHWRYEQVDIAPLLKAGRNVIAVSVWNDGQFAPLAQITGGRTGLMVEAVNRSQSRLIDGPRGWSVRVDASRSVASGMKQVLEQTGPGFYAAGGPETIDAAAQVPGWETGAKAGGWASAVALSSRPAALTLVPDTLPQMTFTPVSSGKVVRTSGVKSAGAFPLGALTVPANTEARILVDAGRVLAAYPALTTSRGKGAKVTLTYSEALYDPVKTQHDPLLGDKPVRFADRARVSDGRALGLTDTLLPDGGVNRRLAPYWWRTWRFVEIAVKTGAEPLTLERLDTTETGYPFEKKAHFVSSDPELNRIWQIGWNTALLDAHETYMDTAYWEQLQYIGDTRIQMLLSYDVSGDDRLAVQALEAFDHSRVVEGLPQSAWPETNKNVIPPFALLWINSLHDYWMRRPDTGVIQRTLAGTRTVLDWYVNNLSPSGIVQEKSGWPFVDWSGALDGWAFRGGKGPQNCVISMQYYGALRDAVDLERAVGDAGRAADYTARADAMRQSLNAQCWDEKRGLYADTPDKTRFSQHAGILAVLYDLVPAQKQAAMIDKVTVPGGGIAAPQGMLGSTYYFSFYLARALDHAGLGDRYPAMLKPWRRMIAQNFTTFPEMPDPSRSDSHAWSAHPTSGMLAYIAGIEPAAPGFAKVSVAPHLGDLTSLDAAMVHPQGLIETRYRRKGGTLEATVILPGTLDGDFAWKEQHRALTPGVNTFTLSE